MYVKDILNLSLCCAIAILADALQAKERPRVVGDSSGCLAKVNRLRVLLAQNVKLDRDFRTHVDILGLVSIT
jgi:hypothetical protein